MWDGRRCVSIDVVAYSTVLVEYVGWYKMCWWMWWLLMFIEDVLYCSMVAYSSTV